MVFLMQQAAVSNRNVEGKESVCVFHNRFNAIRWEFPSGARSHAESYDFRNQHLIIEVCEREKLKDCYLQFVGKEGHHFLQPRTS